MMDNHVSECLLHYENINIHVNQLNELIIHLSSRLKNNEINTAKGLSFLQVKYQLLLFYVINLVILIYKKISGNKLNGDSTIQHLVGIKTVLEKIKPIDYKLKYQIDKLIKNTVFENSNGQVDPNNYKANPNALMDKIIDDESDEDGDNKKTEHVKKGKVNSQIYMPPKLSAAYYDGDETAVEKSQKLGERTRKREISAAILQELKEEYLDAPAEDSHANQKKLISNREYQKKIEYEENYMTRLPVTKKEKHNNRQYSTLNTLGDELTNFKSSCSSKKRKNYKNKSKKNGKKIRFT